MKYVFSKTCFTLKLHENLRLIFFKMFFKQVSSAHQGRIYLIKNTVKTVILLNIFTI